MQILRQWTVQGDHVGAMAHPFLAHVGMLARMASVQAAGSLAALGFHVGATQFEVDSARGQNNSARTALGVAKQTMSVGDGMDDDQMAITNYRGAASAANNAAHMADVAAHTPSGVNAGQADAAKSAASAAWSANGAAAGAGSRDAARSACVQAISSAEQAINAADAAISSAPIGGGPAPAPDPGGGNYPASLVSAAQAASGAIGGDSGYCKSVGRNGSAVNSAVHNFKAEWNKTQSPKVPIGTGQYEGPTAAALAKVLGGAPPACSGGGGGPPPPIPAKKTVTCPDGSVHPEGYTCPKAALSGFFGDWGIWMLLGVGLAGGYMGYSKYRHGSYLPTGGKLKF